LIWAPVFVLSPITDLFFSSRELCEPLELQLDYWLVPNAYKEMATRSNEPNKRMDTKFTLKTGFKSLHISRLFLTNEEPLAFFTVSYIKEKKQKSKYILQTFSQNNVFSFKISNCFGLNDKITQQSSAVFITVFVQIYKTVSRVMM